MQGRNGTDRQQVILHVELSRAEQIEGGTTTGVVYTMKRLTPHGTLTASLVIEIGKWMDRGACVFDGHAHRELAETLQREETKLELELYANSAYGVDASEVAA